MNSSPPVRAIESAGPAVAEQHLPGTHERLVAGPVAEAVVHRLEVVEVADHHAQRLARAQRALDLGVQLAVEREPVLEAGQGVGERRLGEAVHELGHAVANRAQDARRREQDAHEREPAGRHRISEPR